MYNSTSFLSSATLSRRAALAGACAVLSLFLGAFQLRGEEPAEAFLVAPLKIFTGSEASVTVYAFSGENQSPREAAFRVGLGDGSAAVEILGSGKTDATGWGKVTFTVPRDAGDRNLSILIVEVDGLPAALQVPLTLMDVPVLVLETDKPIYKPGQKILGRVLLLNNALRPKEGRVELEIFDAKGNKIDRKELVANAYGAASFELALANELNCGEWALEAKGSGASIRQTVRVEPYVLPRFKTEVELDKDWFLGGEAIAGTVRSSYFFGKPVEGELVAVGSRFDGEEWCEYARSVSAMVAGSARFELPPAGSEGGVTVDLAVKDAAGHEEKAKQFVRIVGKSIQGRLVTASPTAKPGFPYDLYVETTDPGGRPASAPVNVLLFANDDEGQILSSQKQSVLTQGGRASVTFLIPPESKYLQLELNTDEGSNSVALARLYGPVAHSPTGSYVQLVRRGDGAVSVGEAVRFDVESNRGGETFFEVLAGGRSVLSGPAGDEVRFTATPSMAPEAKVMVYRIFGSHEVGADSHVVQVRPSSTVDLKVEFDGKVVEPGAPVKLEISAGVQSLVGLAVVDESVLALGQSRLDLSKVYADVASRSGGPTQEELQSNFAARPHTVGSMDLLAESGLVLAFSPGAQAVAESLFPQGSDLWPGGSGKWGGYGLPDLPPLDGGGDGLAEVGRVRQFFPETWVWEPELLTDTAGKATLELTAPDSITNWKMKAVSTSDLGLGLASGDLTVFQDFFVEPDLPYAVTRGEEFWLPVAVYNYLYSPQAVQLELEAGEGVQLLGSGTVKVDVAPNSVEGASFPVKAVALGSFPLKLTARGQSKADAVIRPLKVEPEGVRQETVENAVLIAGGSHTFGTDFPARSVEGSQKLLLTVTGSQVAQTIKNVEDLCGVPYG